MSWLRLDLVVAPADVDEVGDLLLHLGAVSVTASPGSQDTIVEPAPGTTPLWQHNRLSALLPLDADIAAIRRSLAERLEIDVSFVDDADWQDSWRAHAVDHCFAGRLWVVPRDAPPPGGLVLRLDPGLAFGTGAHPTTRLCLEWLARQDLAGLRVLDFGCGSGILALAACVLGAGQVVAIDNDPQALLATRGNAAYNQISGDRLIVRDAAGLSRHGEFDVIVANILMNPLLELAPRLTSLLRPRGALVLSGLQADQADRIVRGYPGIEFEPPVQEGEWLRLTGLRSAGGGDGQSA